MADRGEGAAGSPGGLHANSQDLTASDLPPFGGNEPGAGNTEQRSYITSCCSQDGEIKVGQGVKKLYAVEKKTVV